MLPFDTVSKMLSSHIDSQALRQVYKSIGLPKTRELGLALFMRWFTFVICVLTIHDYGNEKQSFQFLIFRTLRKQLMVFLMNKTVAASLILLMHMVDFINHSSEYSEEILSFLRANNSLCQRVSYPVHWK